MSSRLRAAFLFAVVQFACTAWAAPCLAPPSACVEWVSVAGGSARAMVYRNHAIDARNDAVTQALIVIHGQGRDADNYYRHALAAGFLAGALDRTLIIAPRFASNEGRGCRDSGGRVRRLSDVRCAASPGWWSAWRACRCWLRSSDPR